MKKRLVPKRTFQHFFYGIRFFCNNIFIFVSFTRLITDPDTKRTDNAENANIRTKLVCCRRQQALKIGICHDPAADCHSDDRPKRSYCSQLTSQVIVIGNFAA